MGVLRVVGITSYDRNECLYELIERLDDAHIVVVDDHSREPVKHPRINTLIRNEVNYGRERYYKTVQKLFLAMQRYTSKHYYMIPDDFVPVENYFDESRRLWESINDPAKVALHLTNNSREVNWTRVKRTDYSDELYKTQNTEFHFLCCRKFLRVPIKPVSIKRWIANPLAGSGVGEQINNFWVHRRKKNIYGVKKSLITRSTRCTESKMNPEARKKHRDQIV